MSCKQVYTRLHTPLEKIEVLSQLAPVLEDDAKQAFIFAVILECVNDYAGHMRRVLDDAASRGREEEGQA